MPPSSIHPMTNEELTGLAMRWPGVTTDIKWGADLVLSVGGKMFCARAADAPPDAPLSFKVAPERFLELTGRPGFAPAPCLARAGWVQASPRSLAPDELRALLRASYELIRAKLPKKTQHALAD
jgi:predicted DNA-binding protein (MmcQ/YjbR family)